VPALNPRLIHVRCTDTGAWTVHPGDRDPPVSVHGTETEAERAACARVDPAGGAIVIHDRYRRTRVVRRPRSGVRAGA
jgi:Uncharacterized protein conserved in bacteria (DUF2188)